MMSDMTLQRYIGSEDGRMGSFSRCWILGLVFVGMGGGLSVAQQGTVTAPESKVLSEAKAFPFDQMTVRKMTNGGEGRSIVQGVLKTGESVSLHESMQPVGAVPSLLHKIDHSEFIVVTDGTVQFEHDGKTEKVGPGSVVYVAFGTIHRLVNVGNVPAKYVVIAIGGDTKK